MDYGLTRQLLDQGRLPNLATLNFAPLQTTFPPQSPVAWSSFITGLNPGGHGIYDFVHRNPGTLEPVNSTTAVIPPGHSLDIGPYKIALESPVLENLMHGEPFWRRLSKQRIESTFIKLPANFPPHEDECHRSLAGMGVPDLLGGYGQFTLFAADEYALKEGTSGGRVEKLKWTGDEWSGRIVGPANPTLRDGAALELPVRLKAIDEGRIQIWIDGDVVGSLAMGEWSPWIPIHFKMLMGLVHFPGMVRFQLLSLPPALHVYMSPINVDPMDPAMPVSFPNDFSSELAKAAGRFYTQGMPEDTKALGAGVWDHDQYLRQVRMVFDEEKRLLEVSLDRYLKEGRGGVFFFYFSAIDQASHIFWSMKEKNHPGYREDFSNRYGEVVPGLYEEIDGILGSVRRRIGDEDIILLSDHGFSDLHRLLDVNRWLVQEGFMKLKRNVVAGERVALNDVVDWSGTQAYSIGFNALYLNQKGREPMGTVPSAEAAELMGRISNRLAHSTDPLTGDPIFSEVPASAQEYGRTGDSAPDLLLGYNPHYSSSWITASGEIGSEVLANNLDAWMSGHNVHPRFVPGVLFSTLRPPGPEPRIEQLGSWIQTNFGIK